MEDLLADPQPSFAIPDTALPMTGIFSECSLQSRPLRDLGATQIAVASPDGSESNSLTITLARHLASKRQERNRDRFTRGRLDRKYDAWKSTLPGLFDVLAGAKSLRDVVYQDNALNGSCLDFRQAAAGAADLENMPQLVDALRDSYDFPIFACGNAGAAGIGKIADAETVILIPASPEPWMSAKCLNGI